MKRLFIFTIGCLLLVIGFLLYQWYWPVQPSGSVITKISIVPGEGVHQISRDLYDGALIHNRWWWETYVWLRGWGSRFQIGEFEISPAMSGVKIASILTAHEGQTDRVVTIIEGWTSSQINEKWGFSIDLITNDHEGYLFPDTYRISKYATDPTKQLVEKALANFDNKVTPELRAEIKRQGHTLHEVVTMASILEAEVRTPEDRAYVSDIFWRRVKIGMALQADSTVNYVTGKNHAAVSLVDTKVDSPYNTYKYRGFPPGPINNPGLSAIRAAIYPKANDNWYFLTAKDGHVVYAKTFAEHVANKWRYLRH